MEKIIAARETPEKGREFLVKYKALSYLHVEWLPESFFDGDKFNKQRLIKFMRTNLPTADSEEYAIVMRTH